MSIKSRLKRIVKSVIRPAEAMKSNTEHWSDHNVTFHKKYKDKAQSLDHLDSRNVQYLFYDQLMPVKGFDGKVILDYGCGPGHDTVGFAEFSKPKKIYAIDISETSINEAKERMNLHDASVTEFICIKDGSANFPMEDESVDYIHCSGVLHHTPNEEEILKEFYRVLKKGGSARLMMYNYNSIFVQLHVGYMERTYHKRNADVPFAEALRINSDYNCPKVRFYKKEKFIKICDDVGFTTSFIGAAIHVSEMHLMPFMYQALQDNETPPEIRNFLKNISFDRFNRPVYKEDIAGIDAVYELKKY